MQDVYFGIIVLLMNELARPVREQRLCRRADSSRNLCQTRVPGSMHLRSSSLTLYKLLSQLEESFFALLEGIRLLSKIKSREWFHVS